MREPTRLPGHTCPAIDTAKSAFRRLAWRAIEDPTDREAIRARVREGFTALEQVRAENTQLRAAYWELRATKAPEAASMPVRACE